MADVPTFLADKSALARRQTRAEIREALDPLLLAGEIATCGIVDLEMLYSASSPATYSATAEALRGMPRSRPRRRRRRASPGGPSEAGQTLPAPRLPLPDLLVAACAENAGLTVLHYDADYERIAKLTGQAVQWVVPRGSVS